MGGYPPRPHVEALDEIAIEESLLQQPGGRDAPPGFMEAIWTGHKERYSSRKKALHQLRTLDGHGTAEILVKLHSLRPPDSHVHSAPPPPGTIYPLSELFFYLRFFGEIKQNYLEAPRCSHPDWEVFSLYAQSLGEGPGLKTFLENKLENLTACGHLADTLLEKIYFGNSQEARASASKHPINALDMGSRLDALKKARHDGHYIVRIEVNGNHVYLLDLNSSYSARIESLIHICDSSARYRRKNRIDPELESCRGRYDVFTVMEYDPQAASTRLQLALRTCFSPKTLKTKYPMGNSQMEWNNILDFVYRINVASQVRGIGAFKTSGQYI